MIRSRYRKFVLGRQMRDAVRRGQVELGEGVSFSPSLQLKLDGGPRLQLRIGSHTHLDGRIVVRGDGFVGIGSHCSFRAGTYLGAVTRLDIGNSVFGAEGIFVVDNNNHPVDAASRLAMTQVPMGHALWQWTAPGVEASPIWIGDNVWLGRNCAVMKGVRVGAGSVVALGAIVTKSAPEFSVLAGNPARVVKAVKAAPESVGPAMGAG